MDNIYEFMEILSSSGHEFPYTDFNKINLDWICTVLKEFLDTLRSGGFTMPSGGTTGQVLGKLSDDDYSAGWIDQSGGGSGGTTNYNQLTNKPKINNVELSGSKTAEQLGLVQAVTGMGLSQNSFTDAEKRKLAGIAAGAQVNPDLSGYALKTWVTSRGYITLADLPIYNGGVS